MANPRYIQNFALSYPSMHKLSVVSASSGKQILLQSFSAYNNSSGTCDVSLNVNTDPTKTELYSHLGVALNLSSFNLFTANATGVIVRSSKPFNMFAFQVSTAQATGGFTFSVEYWNGSAWTAVASSLKVTSFTSTGEDAVLWNTPVDWAKDTNLGSATVGKYSIRILATSVPSTTVVATTGYVAYFLMFRNIYSNNFLQAYWLKDMEVLLEANESLGAYFSVPFAKNSVEVTYRFND